MSTGETNQSEIARIVQVDRSIVCRDVDYLRQRAIENIAKYVDERLPEEYEKCLVGLNSILKGAWTMSQAGGNLKSDKIEALALAKECYAMKLELLTNATVVDDVIRFILSNSKASDEKEENERSGLLQISFFDLTFKDLNKKDSLETADNNLSCDFFFL